jgi:hypothetical protein
LERGSGLRFHHRQGRQKTTLRYGLLLNIRENANSAGEKTAKREKLLKLFENNIKTILAVVVQKLKFLNNSND